MNTAMKLNQMELAEWSIDPKYLSLSLRSSFKDAAAHRLGQINDLVNIIIEYLKTTLFIFDDKDWNSLLGKVNKAPKLPHGIERILQRNCPFFPGKKIWQTHMLVYLPSHVNNKELSLNHLESLFSISSNKKYNVKFNRFDEEIKIEIGDLPNKESQWVLMTEDVLPETRNKTCDERLEYIKKFKEWKISSTLSSSVCIFAKFVKCGVRLYCENPPAQPTFLQCQDEINELPINIGGFSKFGLNITNYFYFPISSCGIAGQYNLLNLEKTNCDSEK